MKNCKDVIIVYIMAMLLCVAIHAFVKIGIADTETQILLLLCVLVADKIWSATNIFSGKK